MPGQGGCDDPLSFSWGRLSDHPGGFLRGHLLQVICLGSYGPMNEAPSDMFTHPFPLWG